MMSHEQDAIKEILKGINYMINNALSGVTQIYDGVVVSQAGEKWNVRYNGEVHLVKKIGNGVPQINSIVKVYVPQGNYSSAWFEPPLNPYPVGAVYISIENVSPQVLFGGEWEKIEGRFLLGASVDYPAGEAKGEATHTLTQQEMPQHTHNFKATGFANQTYSSLINSSSTYPNNPGISTSVGYTSGGYIGIDYTGGSKPHNNMPPYLAVYMWKRIG